VADRPSVVVSDLGKRFVKYVDPPLLVDSLRLRRRVKRSRLWALRHANFEIGAGESVGVIGRNGSGKSTLLQLISGVTAPTEGSVRVSGRVAPLISVGVGFHPELTGRENVYVNGTILGLTRSELDNRLDEIIEFAEIEEFIDTPVKFYSSGMFVRLGFAVAVLADPDVLLIDEVLAVGDAKFIMKCYARMAEIQALGTTIIVVSHNLNAIQSLCSRTLVVHRGELRHDGDTKSAISLYHDLMAADSTSGNRLPSSGDSGQGDFPIVAGRLELIGSNGQPTAHVDSTDEVALALEIEVLRPVEDVIWGPTIVNQTGAVVYGESTPWSSPQRFEPGSTARLEARLRPELATGSYTATMAITNLRGDALMDPPPPVLFYVDGRRLVRGVADLHARLEAHVHTDPATSELWVPAPEESAAAGGGGDG
jgi:ABC-type polysaccharide/polyol phosphate transport system ATPase subunit